ncbi:phosphoribosyltransferase [Allostreptomyces psammosilenae]|uniref:Adenine/guanine phosphoribosyltransferase-like PRPP-binding protein n=1 Tax=Allostreptomyces psammosilenae TaxID=1892865 RepID=A0A853A8G2_9ACTN|nr:phosphoribosyltransferase [Allostreptomyces psammosilenae]NYI06722.1 adenine/guanine phosphoribosyltransferase-like PRPP-binding protein [Allostreptomyces psammosilenae]
MNHPAPTWTGTWVTDHLGLRLHSAARPGTAGDQAGAGRTGGHRHGGDPDVSELVGLAIRDNPRRAHLLVSTVLGKHVPQDPAVVLGAGRELGRRTAELLRAAAGEGADGAAPLVLGFAETATALGHAVADGIGDAAYLHSTRRAVPGVRPVGGFEEEHSHATSHLLLPEDPALLAGTGPLVLVDDELSTGRTCLNTIEALHALAPRTRYVIAALVDMRTDTDRAHLADRVAALGARLDVVSLAAGTVRLPEDALERGAELVRRHRPAATVPSAPVQTPAPVRRIDLDWPQRLPDGGRHGFTPRHRERLESHLPRMAKRIASALDQDGSAPAPDRVLVLGTEELMYAPLRLADSLSRHWAEAGRVTTRGHAPEVRFSTTTRSPALAVDDPGYALRTVLTFPAHDLPDGPDEPAGTRYAYNVAPGADPTRRFDAVVLVTDDVADSAALHAPGGLLTRLAAVTDRLLHAVVPAYRPTATAETAATGRRTAAGATGRLPEPLEGPDFSSYSAADVRWLLTDLSGVRLEAPTEEREEAIQSGGAHYAESLPVEYQPSEQYQALFHAALDDSARRIAHAVGVVTETVLAERGPGAVIASLARAGTPVGILMRRWAAYAHGLDLPHYAVSIVRGRGIDQVALRWLAANHNPADVVFVDGWTGKGAITRELREALAAPGTPAGFDPALAVLADPGGCVETFGTRDDFLIPSACLNSTVSGLVSRTVLRADLIGPDMFHGAKFYRELAGADVSGQFLDTVCARFPEVADAVATDWPELAKADRTPTWAGWDAVERISAEYGIGDVNLVKPGVGETTRVLLRRVPWRILARRDATADLAHVRLLAEQRGVPVVEVDDLPYSCVGLIHPRFTRAAVGADGTAAGAGAGAGVGSGVGVAGTGRAGAAVTVPAQRTAGSAAGGGEGR